MSVLAAAIIGIAAMGGDKPCAAFEGKLLAPQAVTLVSADDPSRRIAARLGERMESCGALENGQIGGTHYELETSEELDSLWFAVIGDASKLRFRTCTSYEGVHFFVHRGKRRLFYEYFYFGYDVEPTCLEHDDWQ